MIINIDEDWRLSSDPEQWIVQERKNYTSKDGNKYDKWKNIYYFTSLDNAVSSLYQRRLRLSDADGIVECTAYASNLCKQLSTALKPLIHINLPEFISEHENKDTTC